MKPAGVDDAAVLETAATWSANGHDVALATVLQTWGSAPRGPGSHLAIRDDGLFVGSVSGGCVEGAVVQVAQGLMGSGRSEIAEYGVTNEDAWDVGLACGGTIRVGITDLGAASADLAAVAGSIEARRPVALRLDFGESHAPVALREGDRGWAPELGRAFSTGTPLLHPDPEQPSFVRIYAPPLRLLVIGAVHIARALAPMAEVAGYDVTIVDPRRAFANPEAWGDVTLVHDYPDDAFETIGLDARTAVVALTHDPKIDDPGLQSALRSDAFYVGALGSKRTHAKRLERLATAGFEEAALARIHGPVGLSIGAATPPEIAVAILAEVIATLRRRPAEGR